jgi:hypothetical protein
LSSWCPRRTLHDCFGVLASSINFDAGDLRRGR